MKFAVVINDQVVEIRDYPSQPECKKINGKPTIRPFIEAEETDTMKHDGYTITDTEVTRKLAPKTLQEVKDAMRVKTAKAKAAYYQVTKEKQLHKAIDDATTVAELTALDFVNGW